MSMAADILKRKSIVEIGWEVRKNPKYIKANKEFCQLVDKTLPKEKVQELDELMDILIDAVFKAYFREGEKFGEKLGASLLFD